MKPKMNTGTDARMMPTTSNIARKKKEGNSIKAGVVRERHKKIE